MKTICDEDPHNNLQLKVNSKLKNFTFILINFCWQKFQNNQLSSSLSKNFESLSCQNSIGLYQKQANLIHLKYHKLHQNIFY